MSKKSSMISFQTIWRGMCKLCAYLFVPQMGRQRHRMEQLKKDITYIIGNERAEGSIVPVSPLYISRVLNVPLKDVEKCMKEI